VKYNYSQELKAIQEAHYYTLEEMARKANIPMATMYNQLNGWIKRPRLKTRVKLNKFIDKYKAVDHGTQT